MGSLRGFLTSTKKEESLEISDFIEKKTIPDIFSKNKF